MSLPIFFPHRSPMESSTVTKTTLPNQDGTETEPTEFEKNRKRYQDLIDTFPHVKGWRPKNPLIEYGGYWFLRPRLEGCLYAQEFFEARPIDFFICSYPKTDSALFRHKDVQNDKGNTLFSAHLPHDLLPESISKSGCKIVYIWRDPKDTFISLWTFIQNQMIDYGPINSLEESFDMFCRGLSAYGPYLDHVLSYWKAYQDNPAQMLFLKYETMRADPLPYVKILAEFMGYEFTAEEEKEGVVEKVVNLCSFETLKNLEHNKEEKAIKERAGLFNSAFFRKGKVGDWQNYLTPAMATRIDGLLEEKFKGTGLLLEHAK